MGQSGASAFRLSTAAVSTSLAGSCSLRKMAPRPLFGALLVKRLSAWCGRNDDQRGARLRARFESRHNLVSGRSKDLNHDAVMRIGSEAPKRRTHSSNRHESQGPCRDSATSNHHRRPVTSERTRRKLSRYLQHPPFIVQDTKRRRPVQRPPERAATERSEACVPRPRSWSCECRGRSRCGLETTAPKRCSFGT